MAHLREPKLAWSYLSLSPKTQGVEDTVLQGARATPSRDDSPGSRHYGAGPSDQSRVGGTRGREASGTQHGGRQSSPGCPLPNPTLSRHLCEDTARTFHPRLQKPFMHTAKRRCRHSLPCAELDGRKDADSAGKLRRAIYVRSARKCPPLTMAIWG